MIDTLLQATETFFNAPLYSATPTRGQTISALLFRLSQSSRMTSMLRRGGPGSRKRRPHRSQTLPKLLTHWKPRRARSADKSREALTDNEYTVLRQLRDKRPRLVLLEDLAADTGIAVKACGQIVRSLIARGLAERPNERKGATITLAGEACQRRRCVR